MVMLVDDQPIVAERVRMDLLADPSIDFHYCQDPADLIGTAAEIRPTVILLDLLMPGVNGYDMIRRLRHDPVTSDIPIIVLSAREQVDCKAEAFARGANDYLIKLPDKRELVARVLYHSRAYINKLQRDAAFNALRESQRRLEQKNFELMKMSNVDGLTGVSNRRHFDTLLAQVWAHAHRSQSPLSLIMLDIDYFKYYNDNYGHLAGDDCLRSVAETIREQLPRATDFVARFGGEEFAVVLDATDAQGATTVAGRLLAAIDGLAIKHGASPIAAHVTVSLGIASTVPQPGQQPKILLARADQALYEAKAAGRHCFVNGNGMPGTMDTAIP
ncbi:diguanylate cyclase [Thiohalobacter thiocyanaticus]|uniref:diguanylate cyclase n=2 Tax=Thiohalobacter thiocyanaticus TaxID=585455 RepID=A0A426QJW7_9GAMM|nr:diguanylate cyclase [Thiohalobacter thiocyanaticus]